MHPLGRWLFNALAALSLLLFIAIIGEELVRFPDNDFSIFWSFNGRLISVDSFEDLPDANAITMREFSPWSVWVPLQFRYCSVEGGDEVPTLGLGNQVDVWIDRNGQPGRREYKDHVARPADVRAVWQIPLHGGVYLFLSGVVPAIWCVAKSRSSYIKHYRRADDVVV